jgi:acetyl-CoA carboxylase biotin carboxylase subunit
VILRRILIANRGEIAVRILRTCHQLGIEAVLAASDADRESVPARLADSVVRLGPAAPADSYLSVGAVVAAALAAGADAVHPGYGFLSENPALARACEAAGVVFIGPTVAQLEAVGDKLTARQHATAAGLPVAEGGEVASATEAAKVTAAIGFPVLVKAVGGGGGRGLRPIYQADALADTVTLAMAEAAAAFGDPRVYLEQYLPSGRHVEVQLLGDGDRVIHLGDRDCSVQRRYQKLIEEAPAPLLDEDLRAAIRQAAVDFGSHLGYRGAGTVEFLVDPGRRAFYFLEMNARIQVEHPVTETISGVDIVAEQIWLAEGNRLRIAQDDVVLSGHAIECRINAENADTFLPSPGRVTGYHPPGGLGVRVDSALYDGYEVPPYYDSLVSKLIVHGKSRNECLMRLRRALEEYVIGGIDTTIPLHQRLAVAPEFIDGDYDIHWLEDFVRRPP